jgi:RpiB/LacA/LacB family sugar-phosphate isomerase
VKPCSSLKSYCPLKATKVVGIASDHAGHELKEYLAMMLREAGAEVIDFGDRTPAPEDDYPDFVEPLARAVAAGDVERGVAICGSGVGACVVVNKVRRVRSCLINDPFSAHQGVEDDDLNLICLGGFVVGHALAWELVRIFLYAQFSNKERHRRRLGKVMEIENHPHPKSIRASDKVEETTTSAKQDSDGNVSSHTSLKLYLIRHGETEWSRSGQYTGSTDIPLTPHGEAAARGVGERLHDIPFSHVFASPLKRAQQTCNLATLQPPPTIEPDLREWDAGDFEGRTPEEIHESHPGWNLFRDGSPHGESATQMSDRVDHLIAFLRTLEGNVALFSHGHLCRVLAARWIGLPVEHAERLLLSTASISILGHGHDRFDLPAIALWNSVPAEHSDLIDLKRRALDRWENEGGNVPSESSVPPAHSNSKPTNKEAEPISQV